MKARSGRAPSSRGRGEPADLGLGRLDPTAFGQRPGRPAGRGPLDGRLAARVAGGQPGVLSAASVLLCRLLAGATASSSGPALRLPDPRQPGSAASSGMHLRGLRLELVGVAARAVARPRVPPPDGAPARRPVDPVPRKRSAQRREPVPRLLRAVHGAVGLRRPPSARSRPRAAAPVASARLDLSTTLPQGGLVGRPRPRAWAVIANRSSAKSNRSRESRRSDWMTAARRATSACLPSGVSWRRSSTVRPVHSG